MATPTIMCLACNDAPEFKTDKEYKEHLLKIHGASTTQGAMDIERSKRINTPVNLPGGISQKDLPNKEFLEAVKRIEEEKKQALTPPPSPTVQPTLSTLVLKYRYEGRVDCGHEVKTIMIETEGKLFAIGYDIICDKMVKRIEVFPIKEDKNGTDGNKTKTAK